MSNRHTLNADRLIFSGNASGIDDDIHIESSNPNHKIVFTNSIDIPLLNVPIVKTDTILNLGGDVVLDISDDVIKIHKPFDFNNQPLLNMGQFDLQSNQILSSNLAGQSAPNNTLDKELDNLTVNVHNNTNRTTGLTTNKIIRSNNSGTIQVGSYDEGDFIRNNTATQQTLLGDLHFPSGKGIKYDNVLLNHTHLDGFEEIQDKIQLNSHKIGISIQQSADIETNNNKIGITEIQRDHIIINSNKIGITEIQRDQIIINSNKNSITTEQSTTIQENQNNIVILNDSKISVSSPMVSGISNGILRVTDDVINSTTITLEDIPDIPISKISNITSTLDQVYTNTQKNSFTSENQTQLQNATNNITSITSDISNLTNVVDTKVDKLNPSFSLGDGICRIIDNVLVTGFLSHPDIPNLPAGKINVGVINLDRIPNIDSSRIPELDCSKLVSGTIDSERLPGLSTNKITNGVFDVSRIPSLSISKINDFTPIQNAIDINSNKISFTLENQTQLENAISDISTTQQDVGFLDILKVNKSSPSFSGLSNGVCIIDNNVMTSRSIEVSDIPDLPLSKISSGTLTDDRLSSNIMRLDTDQTVIGTNTFSNLTYFSNGLFAGNVQGSYSFISNEAAISLKSVDTGSSIDFNYESTSTRLVNSYDGGSGLVLEGGDLNIIQGRLLIGGSHIALANLSDGANVLKSGVQQGNIDCNGDFHIRDSATNGAIISYEQANNNTFFSGTNVYMLDASGNTTMSVSLSNTNPNIIINNSSDIARGSVGVFANISSLKSSVAALQGLSNSYVDLSSNEIINGTKQFSNQINVIDGSNQDNMTIIHPDGRLYMRNTDNGSSFVQMITNNTSVKLSCDVASLSLLCDRDINLQTGRVYKINNVALNSTNLTDSGNLVRKNVATTLTQSLTISGLHTFTIENSGVSASFEVDSEEGHLGINQNVNLPTGKTYKIGNTNLNSTHLSDFSQLMRKPNIWTQSNTGQIKIQTTFDSNNILFQQSDLFNNTFTGVNEALPLGFYTLKIDMIPSASSQQGIYQFMATAPIHFTNTTNDSDSTPEIKLNLTNFHHASQHGLAQCYLVPKAGNAWEVYLIFDSIDPTRTNDTFNCRIALREEYWD